MITKFKIFEKVHCEIQLEGEFPKIGDFVICRESINALIDEFLSTHVGEIVGTGGLLPYTVSFGLIENLPDYMKSYFNGNLIKVEGLAVRDFESWDIVNWSTHKKDLESHITSKRFDL